MLLAGISFALGLPKADRHAYQEEVAAQVGDVLRGIERNLAAAAAKARAAADVEAQEAVTRCTREHQESVAAVDAAKADVLAKVEDAEKAQEAVLHADVAKSDAATALRTTKKKHEALEKEKVQLEGVMEGPLATLVEGTWTTDKEQQKLFGTLRSAIEKLGAEESILTAMPHALSSKPPRGSFDQVIVDQLKALVGGKLASTNDDTAAAVTNVAEAEKSVSAAEELVESERATADSSQERLKQAKAWEEERYLKMLEALKRLGDAQSILDASGAMKEKADTELASFVGLLGTYQELLGWATPEPEEPEAAEPKAEAGGA